MGERCPVCGATSIYFDPARREYYCPVCGYVYGYEEVPAHHDQIQAKHDVENAKFELRKATDDDYNYAISEIRRIAANLKLPSYVVKEAERKYKFLRKNGLLHYYTHASIEAIIPALLLLVAREYKININFMVGLKFAKADKKEVSLAYKWLREVFLKAGDRTNTIGGDG